MHLLDAPSARKGHPTCIFPSAGRDTKRIRNTAGQLGVPRTDDWHQIRCQEVMSDYACADESRRSRSMLNGNSVQPASRNAPPLAENTEESKGALIPRAPAIVTANNRSNTPLSRAAVRV